MTVLKTKIHSVRLKSTNSREVGLFTGNKMTHFKKFQKFSVKSILTQNYCENKRIEN